jgi:hypothetical protein
VRRRAGRGAPVPTPLVLTVNGERRGEARRVLRPGGLLAAAGTSRFAFTVDGLAAGVFAEPDFEEVVAQALRDGRHLDPGGHGNRSTCAFRDEVPV